MLFTSRTSCLLVIAFSHVPLEVDARVGDHELSIPAANRDGIVRVRFWPLEALLAFELGFVPEGGYKIPDPAKNGFNDPGLGWVLGLGAPPFNLEHSSVQSIVAAFAKGDQVTGCVAAAVLAEHDVMNVDFFTVFNFLLL